MLLSDQIIDKLEPHIQDRNIKILNNYFFEKNNKDPYEPTPIQRKIIETIGFELHNKITLNAMTRWGKTKTVSRGICLNLILNGPKDVALIGPTSDQADVLNKYIREDIELCPILRKRVVGRKNKKKLYQRNRMNSIDFTDGSNISTYSAENTQEGSRLLSHGADMLVKDEAVWIPEEVWGKISRMKGDSWDSYMDIEMSNPYKRNNRYFDHFHSDQWLSFHVDWETAIKENRTSKKYIMNQKKELPHWEFQVLYESQFPEKSEHQLIPWNWIDSATQRSFQPPENCETIWGLDVAGKGNDLNVLSKVLVWQDHEGNKTHKLVNQWSNDIPKTTRAVRWVHNKIGEKQLIKVDSIGIGSGVRDQLEEKGHEARLIDVRESPQKDKKFKNQKSEGFWKLRSLFEEDRIDIPEISELSKQLSSLEVTYSTKKRKIEDGQSKSPDHADSLMLTLLEGSRSASGGTVKKKGPRKNRSEEVPDSGPKSPEKVAREKRRNKY